MLLLLVSGVAPVNWGILGDWMGEEHDTTYRCLLVLHLMTSIIFFLLLGWHGLCWTYRLSRTKRLKGERIPELRELSSLHGRTEDHSVPPSGDHPEGKDGPQCCLYVHPGTGLLNTTSCWWSAVGANYWRMPGAFSLHAFSPRRVFEGLVERALGAAWYLALGLCQASGTGQCCGSEPPAPPGTSMSETWTSLCGGSVSAWTFFCFRGWWETLESMDWKVIRWSEYSLIALCFNFAWETPFLASLSYSAPWYWFHSGWLLAPSLQSYPFLETKVLIFLSFMVSATSPFPWGSSVDQLC